MRGRAVATAVTLGVVVVAGCGGGSSDNGESAKTGPEVASDAAQALQDAGAVHVSGSVTSSGKRQQLDVQLQGPDSSGTVTVDDQSIRFVKTGGTTYFQAPAAYWRDSGVPAQAAALIAGRWVVVPGEAADSFEDITVEGLAEELRNPSDGTIKDEVRTDTLDGRKVVVVSSDEGGELYVAATGQPYPLKTVPKDDPQGTVAFTDYGKQQPIAAPPDPLDLTKLGDQAA